MSHVHVDCCERGAPADDRACALYSATTTPRHELQTLPDLKQEFNQIVTYNLLLKQPS